MKIECMDLSRQIAEHRQEFLDAVTEVIDDRAFSGGKHVKEFEKAFAAYTGTSYCCGLSSGTSALFMAMKAAGIGPGDEVIVPASTFIASAWGICYCGARPVFADCEKDTWEISPQQVEEKITDRTKAVIGVHLYGQPFDFDTVHEIAKRHGIPVIEDCAQSHGAVYKGRKTGSLGDIGCFSFYPGKNLGAFGEAGAVTTNNTEYYEKIEMMKNHGSSETYFHDIEGYNLRMDGIQGAVLSLKLKYLDEWNERRQKIAACYQKGIRNIRIKKQAAPEYVQPVYHLFEVEADDADAFIRYMKQNGVYCTRHYPVPCHLQKVFHSLGYRAGDLPNAEYHAKHCVTLPMYPELTDEEVCRIISIVNDYGNHEG